jgi:hypothetical protein
MLDEENGDSGLGIDFSPETAVVGDWLVLSLIKFWNNSHVKSSTDDHKFGVTVEPPYGKEIRLALPLVDSPKEAPPEGTLTIEQFEVRILKPVVELTRFGIKLAAAPIELS